jgi:hypothetical protein
MTLEIIEENQTAAQVRILCDTCGAYIGTRIMLKNELTNKTKTSCLCTKCKNQPDADAKI